MTNKSAGKTIVIGLGQTGKSCVRFLVSKGIPVVAMDTRAEPPGIEQLRTEFPELEFVLGNLDSELLSAASEIVISPGLSLQHPALQTVRKQGVPIIGDISLFRRYVDQPIVAITGSNAKSTVTTLVGKLLRDAGVSAMVAGNIGIPVMELLNQGITADVYVLELSSFQLETTDNLNAKVATILNVSEDHMDRYKDIEEYASAKQRIYEGCETAVVNADDRYSMPMPDVKNILYFNGSEPKADEFGLIKKADDTWLAMDSSPIIKASELKIKGRHNQVNALAAVAIGKAIGIPMESMVLTLSEFAGLTHRCQFVANINGVDWFNDSKGTNVGATEAAIDGIGNDIKGKIVLIAGGEGKGADFSVLKSPAKSFVKKIVLIGRDADIIATALEQAVPLVKAKDLEEAVNLAGHDAERGDAVVLSPACASFDMFQSFEDRGNQFMQLVHAMENQP